MRKRFLAFLAAVSIVSALLLITTTGASASGSDFVAPSAITTNIETPVSIPGISIADSPYSLVRVHLSVGNGTLTLGSTSAITLTEGDGVDDSVIKFTSTRTNAQTALSGLTFTPAADFVGQTEVDFALMPNDAGLTYNPQNGNFYRRVAGTRTWEQASIHAETPFYGAAGYLATITSAQEQAAISPIVTANSWIGARRYDATHQWQWATGPETGSVFYIGRRSGTNCVFAPCASVEGWYSNWATGEPNNTGGAEDAAQIRTDGIWNDINKNGNLSYIAEYNGDDLTHLASTRVTVRPALTTNRGAPVVIDADGNIVEAPMPPTPLPAGSTTVPTDDASGSWTVLSNGDVLTAGSATSYGSMANKPLNAPTVNIARTPTNNGYYLVGADGGVFTFGDAQFFGSMAGKHLNQPMVAIEPTCSGDGYYLVAEDGGVFTFGDAVFHGSMATRLLNKRMTGIFPRCDRSGYWTFAEDGGVFTFGNDINFFGSGPEVSDFGTLNYFVGASDNKGYLLVNHELKRFRFGSLVE